VFSAAQHSELLELISASVSESDFCNEPLEVLRVIVEKKLLHKAVYAIINDVIKEKLITCYNASVQALCKAIFLSFLAHFPLTEKLVQSFVHFLIKNTEFPGS